MCGADTSILYERSFNLKTISQGDVGHLRENNLIILSKVAKIALKIVFKFKLFSYKILERGKVKRVSPNNPQVDVDGCGDDLPTQGEERTHLHCGIVICVPATGGVCHDPPVYWVLVLGPRAQITPE